MLLHGRGLHVENDLGAVRSRSAHRRPGIASEPRTHGTLRHEPQRIGSPLLRRDRFAIQIVAILAIQGVSRRVDRPHQHGARLRVQPSPNHHHPVFVHERHEGRLR